MRQEYRSALNASLPRGVFTTIIALMIAILYTFACRAAAMGSGRCVAMRVAVERQGNGASRHLREAMSAPAARARGNSSLVATHHSRCGSLARRSGGAAQLWRYNASFGGGLHVA